MVGTSLPLSYQTVAAADSGGFNPKTPDETLAAAQYADDYAASQTVKFLKTHLAEFTGGLSLLLGANA